MILINIADDHPLMREGIKKVINNEADMEICAEASNGKELKANLRNELPDILVLDMTMPGQSGLELLKQIHHIYPKLPVLILSIHPAERFAVRSLKAGASGYLNKASILGELVSAIRQITSQNRRYITEDVAEQLALQIDSQTNKPLHETLSDREFEVLCLIAQGENIKSIADGLSLSPHTVHTYRSRIKEKMNFASNVEMTRYALKNDLIS